MQVLKTERKKEVGLEQNEKGEEEEEEKNFRLLFRGNLRKTQPLSIELARCASVYTTTKKKERSFFFVVVDEEKDREGG